MNKLAKVLPYLTVALVLALAYDGWTFYSRWSGQRDAEKAAAEKQAQDARRTLELLGGDRLKILNFYGPASIRRGQPATLCYGVNQAERVQIDPPVEQLHPSLSHCFQVMPLKDTDYKLTAEDRTGHTVSQNLTIKVLPPF